MATLYWPMHFMREKSNSVFPMQIVSTEIRTKLRIATVVEISAVAEIRFAAVFDICTGIIRIFTISQGVVTIPMGRSATIRVRTLDLERLRTSR